MLSGFCAAPDPATWLPAVLSGATPADGGAGVGAGGAGDPVARIGPAGGHLGEALRQLPVWGVGDAPVRGLLVTSRLVTPAGIGIHLRAALETDAWLAELVPLRVPLGRALLGLGHSGATRRAVSARAVAWRGLGLTAVEQWVCDGSTPSVVTLGRWRPYRLFAPG